MVQTSVITFASNKMFSSCVMEKLINGWRYREYVYSVTVYQKYLTRLRELIIFEPWRENYQFSQPS